MKTEKLVSMSIRVLPETRDKIQVLAEKHGTNGSAVDAIFLRLVRGFGSARKREKSQKRIPKLIRDWAGRRLVRRAGRRMRSGVGKMVPVGNVMWYRSDGKYAVVIGGKLLCDDDFLRHLESCDPANTPEKLKELDRWRRLGRGEFTPPNPDPDTGTRA